MRKIHRPLYYCRGGNDLTYLAKCSPSVRHILLYNRVIIVIASTGQHYESG